MIRYLLAIAVLTPAVLAAQEGPVATQTILTFDVPNKIGAPDISQFITPQSVRLRVNNRNAELTSLTRIQSNGVQVALLIDDGLRTSVGRQISDIKTFITSLPVGTEILVGYMQNGRVVSDQSFTTNHAAASATLRIPLGTPGASASPYLCLSDFVRKWPASESGTPEARFVIMLTNGVDPYNGSVSPMNQNSLYVDNAIRDAQRMGVPVYSIYYGDAGIGGGDASFSGQNYLSQVAEGTGGRAYFQGSGNPVSLTPFFNQFKKSLAESYVATFNASSRSDLIDVKVSTSLSGTKVRSPQKVKPGARITASPQDHPMEMPAAR
jgi:hypothetical protein